MKRFQIGIAILLILLVLAVAVQFALPAVQRPVETALKEALSAAQAENPTEVAQAVRQADAAWQKVRPIAAALADHSLLEEQDKTLAVLSVWSASAASPVFSAACTEALLQLQTICDAHRLSLSNLL